MTSAQPLVSILVRSMDRLTLQRALDSAAAQTWPNLEIVVVAACGHAHAALPSTYRGRPLRLVFAEADGRLSRPDAANLALASARGEWLNFLDDDDELLPQHLSVLLSASRADERVIYSRTRVVDAGGKVLGHVSHAGNHVQLYFHSRATTCATLLHRSLIDEGVRFDPAFAVHEDHDFQVNCATRTEFRFVDEPTCVWHAQAGDSGCGFGDNNDAAQRASSVVDVRRKWQAWFRERLADANAVMFAGRTYYEGGDMQAAAFCFEQVVRLRSLDIEAMQLAARAHTRAGETERAGALLARATLLAPEDAGVRDAARQLQAAGGKLAEQPAATFPLVSILIRSMDRPTLERALDSAAAQTWPNLEIVVIAANGAAHRNLPELWNGRPLRLIYPQPDRRLPRPDAANLAIENAHGEWLNFLDDDDELLPQHVATVLTSSRSSNARVVYARARVQDESGKATGHVGFASFPVQLYFQSRSHPAATIFHRSLVEEGVRFDPAFDVFEDQDFFIHCATRSEFQFVDAVTCIWNAYAGESGCGHGSNDAPEQRTAYTERLHKKWADFFGPLLRQPETLLFVGQQYLRVNDLPVALDCLERALSARPEDVNALNLCAMANLRSGNLDRAELLLNDALRKLPEHAGLRANLDLLRRRRGEQAASAE